MIPAQRRPSAPTFPSGDPRARTDGLGWVTRAVFPDPAVRLGIGDDATASVRFAVIPSLDNARFLLPLASRRVTAAAVLAYNALRPPTPGSGATGWAGSPGPCSATPGCA